MTAVDLIFIYSSFGKIRYNKNKETGRFLRTALLAFRLRVRLSYLLAKSQRGRRRLLR